MTERIFVPKMRLALALSSSAGSPGMGFISLDAVLLIRKALVHF